MENTFKSLQVEGISEAALSGEKTSEDIFKSKVYTNAQKDGFVISNKNNSNQFEYTVYTLDGKEVGKGFAYYNKNIDLTKVSRRTYIFTYKNEKGILQKVRVIR